MACFALAPKTSCATAPRKFMNAFARLSGVDADNHISVANTKDLKRPSTIEAFWQVIHRVRFVERLMPLQATAV